MEPGRLLRLEADAAFAALLESIDGVDEHLSWARQECRPGEYLHTEGSIYSNVVHVAGCKIMYGSAAFCGTEHRWRDMVARFESFWPSWDEARRWLLEAQEYWLSTWEGETHFERLVDTNWGDKWPLWKVIWTVSHHDSYHAGQIQLLRSTLPPTTVPPPREAEDWKTHSTDFSW